MDPHQAAGVDEDVAYIGRSVGEAVPRVTPPATGIREATPVRMDQPTEKKLRSAPNRIFLPARENDPAVVFRSGTVLGEEAWPRP